MSDSKIPKTYDISIGLRNIDGDPITAVGLFIEGTLAPTQAEMDDAEKCAKADRNHETAGAVGLRHFAYELRKEPCPAWRVIRHCLLTQHKVRKLRDGKTVEEDIGAALKQELYELALMITNEVRQGAVNKFKMLPSQVALCHNACARLPTALLGALRPALTPVVEGVEGT